MGAHVRAIKSRIGNVENIGQITKAMNAIAMTKVTRMKKRLAEIRPYVEGLESFAADLIGRLPGDADPHPLLIENASDEVGILVLNADRGLCGRYKGDLNRKAESLYRDQAAHAQILAGGEKARSFFDRQGIEPLRSFAHLYDTVTADAAAQIADEVTALYREGEVGRVELVYMRFVSDLSQQLVTEELLPLSITARPNDLLVEPDVHTILDRTLPSIVRGRVFAALMETKTCEDAIRRQAMRAASDNADELLKNLTRVYNRARQQSITSEIADIIGGAEALRTA